MTGREATRTVVQYADSRGFGGTEQVLVTLLPGLAAVGWRTILIHHADADLGPLLESARRSGIETLAEPRMSGTGAPLRTARLAALLRRLRPDVFHAHLTWPHSCEYGLVAAAVARVPVVVATAHLFMQPNGVTERVAPRLASLAVDRYIAVSADVAQALTARIGIPARKISVIRNGIDLNRYTASPDNGHSNAALRAKLGAQPRGLVVTIAQFRTQKGHVHLVEAATAVPDATFVLVGNGPERPAIEALAARLGVLERVLFVGYRDDVPRLLAAADVFVLPSLYEGLPLSVLEAMAAGTPVVATAVGGTREVVTDGETGLLVPPGDARALAGAINQLLDDAELRTRLAVAARRHVAANFSATRMVDEVASLYGELSAGSMVHGAA